MSLIPRPASLPPDRIAAKFEDDVRAHGYAPIDAVGVTMWEDRRSGELMIGFEMGGRTGRARLLQHLGMGL